MTQHLVDPDQLTLASLFYWANQDDPNGDDGRLTIDISTIDLPTADTAANLYLISPAGDSAHMCYVVALGRRPVSCLAARNLPSGGRKEVRRWQRYSVSMSSNCAQG